MTTNKVKQTIEQILEGGSKGVMYLGIANAGFGFDIFPTKKKNIFQAVTMDYSLDIVAANRFIKKPLNIEEMPIAFPAIGFDCSDKPSMCSSERSFYLFLRNASYENYHRNFMGFVSRPVNLEVQKESIKIHLKDIIKISSKQIGELILKPFEVSFKVKGNVQYGGQLNMGSSDEKYRRLTVWAN